MKFTLEIELSDEIQRGADVVYALQDSLKGEARLPLEVGTAGVLWTRSGDTVGKWEVTETPAEQADGSARLAEVIGDTRETREAQRNAGTYVQECVLCHEVKPVCCDDEIDEESISVNPRCAGCCDHRHTWSPTAQHERGE